MKTKLEESKNQTIEAVIQEINRYYVEFERGSADAACRIGDFERMIMEHKRRLDEILRDAAGKALSTVEAGKKNVPYAAARCGYARRNA